MFVDNTMIFKLLTSKGKMLQIDSPPPLDEHQHFSLKVFIKFYLMN